MYIEKLDIKDRYSQKHFTDVYTIQATWKTHSPHACMGMLSY